MNKQEIIEREIKIVQENTECKKCEQKTLRTLIEREFDKRYRILHCDNKQCRYENQKEIGYQQWKELNKLIVGKC